MATANEEMLDATIRHQIIMLRFSKRQAERAVKLLSASDTEVISLIQNTLDDEGPKRLNSLLKNIRQLRAEMAMGIGAQLVEDMPDFAELEATWQISTLQATVPVQMSFATVAPSLLKAIVSTSPINGIPLDGWLEDLASKDVRRIEQQIRLGMVEGETVQQMVRRIRGTKAANFEDGVMAVTRRNAETIVRTAVNHVSNEARQETWKANADILAGVRWVATLDGRTSPVCQSRDGEVYPIDEGPRPPAHPGCRSTMVPVLRGEAIVGERPTVTDTRTRRKREIDFRAEAKKEAGPEKWKDMGETGRQSLISAKRKQWTKDNIGQTPSNENYQAFLKRQSAGFQDEVLGPARATLFREGVTLDKFVDGSGKQYNLTQLKEHVDADMAELITKLQG